MKLYSAIYRSYGPFADWNLFDKYKTVNHPQDMDDDDGALVVWGGQDISPSLYNKAVGRHTGATATPGRRDQVEWELMQAAKERGMPIIGICRGAQMLCALEGGFLIQDVTNHGRSHMATTSKGENFKVSSLHHQMMHAQGTEHELLAWSTVKRSDHYLDVDTPIEVEIEPECIWFPQAKGLAIQWHPEFSEPDLEIPSQKYVYNLIQERVL